MHTRGRAVHWYPAHSRAIFPWIVARNRPHRSQWQYSVWVTRVTVLLGAVAIVAGLLQPRLLRIPLLSFIAVCAMVLGISAIAINFQGIGPHSRRLRKPIFWLTLIVNLGIVGLVGTLFIRAMKLPAIERIPHPELEDVN